jgi:hypothetical protein
MKKHILIVTLIAAALLGGASAAASPPPTIEGGPRCKAANRNPQLYTFYGNKRTINEGLAIIPAKLSERRVFLQVTQGDSGADVKLYEQGNDGTFAVTKWTTKQSSPLIAKIEEAIVDNEGEGCVAKPVRTILEELGQGETSNGVAAPASPAEAFAPSVNQASGKFIKSTIIILC